MAQAKRSSSIWLRCTVSSRKTWYKLIFPKTPKITRQINLFKYIEDVKTDKMYSVWHEYGAWHCTCVAGKRGEDCKHIIMLRNHDQLR
jgi:hypothetical protein